jgi:hypothetical protein
VGRGLICLTLTEARCRQLDLPLMVRDNKHAARHRLHRLDRGRRGRHHRHLGARPLAHRAGRGGPNATPEDIVSPATSSR